MAGSTYDIKVDPSLDLMRQGVQEETRISMYGEGLLIAIEAPPCMVSSLMQSITQQHHNNNIEASRVMLLCMNIQQRHHPGTLTVLTC